MLSPVAKYLLQALATAGLSQSEFARRAGTAQQLVNAVLKGNRKLPLKHVQRWAEALGAHGDVDRLLQLVEWERLPAELKGRRNPPA